MKFRSTLIPVLAVLFLLPTVACQTTGGSSGGWVVVGDQQPSPPPPAKKTGPPPKKERKSKGLDRASRNHIRSAYRFLEKGKPDHAMRELEKARRKMGQNFWFHYYMGGAYYFKGMFDLAEDSWSMAYRYTRDYRLRSRLRTCQAFAINYIQGDDSSGKFLRMAADMDKENRQARVLLDDLSVSATGTTGTRKSYKNTSKPPFKGAKGGDDSSAINGSRAQDDDDGNGSSKGKKGKKKDDGKRGKGKKKKPKKIRDEGRFRAYFLIEMP